MLIDTQNPQSVMQVAPGMLSVQDLETAGAKAKELLIAAVRELQPPNGEVDPGKRLFFPNGIELIMIAVKAGINPEKPNLHIELKIAGAAGVCSKPQ